MSDAVESRTSETDSYGNILRSTALLGASSVISMFFSLIRMKAIALLLGPAGVGLVALYISIVDMAVAVAGLGVAQAGVRQIAIAEGSGSRTWVAGTIAIVQRTCLVLGIAGGTGLALLAVPAAVLTFGSAEYAFAVSLLGILVLLRLLLDSQTTLLQACRRIRELAALNIIGAIAAAAITVPLIFFWREQAIVPALIVVALVSLIVARWFSQKVPGAKGASVQRAPRGELLQLLRLGFAFLVSGILTMGAAYAVRILVLHDNGVAAAGLYQAAWALSGLYAGVVLQSMGTDFYPRLAGCAHDNIAVNRLVSEQTQVSLLLAGPGVIATMTFSHLLVISFYSAEFSGAAELLRWLCLGMMLRVVSWPMGYIVVAKGWQKAFIGIEIGATVLHVGLAAVLLPPLGPEGAGVAFAGLYLWHGLFVYWIARRWCGYRISPANGRILRALGAATALTFIAFECMPLWWATAFGTLLTSGCALYSLRELRRIMPSLWLHSKLPRWLRRVA